jgi:TIR domain
MTTAATALTDSRIFVSYRREDAAYPAGWLFDRLVDHFGEDRVFRDVDSIELGDDFVEMIMSAVGSCAVLLTVIGARWLTVTGKGGQRRLDDPEDFVRVEIEAAFARGVRVIPVLVDGAQMPQGTELPVSLANLAHRQALELSPNRFRLDTAQLLEELDRKLSEMAGGPTAPLGRGAGPRRIEAEQSRLGEAGPQEPQARPRLVQHKPSKVAQPAAAHRNLAGYWRFWIGLLLIVAGGACLLSDVPHKVGYSHTFWNVPHADTYTQVALVALMILGALLLVGAVFSAMRAASRRRDQH